MKFTADTLRRLCTTSRAKWATIFALTLLALPSFAATHYVAQNGGTGIQSGGTIPQCTGLVNAPYPGAVTATWIGSGYTGYALNTEIVDYNNHIQKLTGTGTTGNYAPTWNSSGGTTTDGTATWTDQGAEASNQACAVNHPFWLLNQSTFQWNIAEGDTVQFEDAGPYYIGQQLNGLGTNWPFCGGQQSACILPPLPNGSSFLGLSAGSCHNSTHSALVNPTQFIALNAVFSVLNIQGAVGTDVECFDISQPDMCTMSGEGSIPSSLNCSAGTNNYAEHGLVLSYLSANGPSNSTVRDMQIHGMANEAVTGGKMNSAGTTMTFSDIYIYGNANTGWDGDAGGCTTNCESTGTINLSYINAYWSGCMEVKPNGGTIGGNGVTTCVDQAFNGNGDNIVMIATGGTWNWNHIITKWGAQDGVDLLHTGDDITSGVVINTNDVDSEGNEGQQWKVGGTATGTNMRLVANCRRLMYPFPPNPTGYNTYVADTCRAFSGVALAVSPGHAITITNSTLVGYANPLYDIDCYTNSTGCPANSYSVVLRDNLMLGYNDPLTTTTPGGLYWGSELTDPFLNTGSAITNMLWAPNTMRASSGSGPTSGCAQDPAEETGTVCGDPLLLGELVSYPNTSLDNFNINLQSGSPAIAAGTTPCPSPDFAGNAQTSPCTVGALVFAGSSTGGTVHSGNAIMSGNVVSK